MTVSIIIVAPDRIEVCLAAKREKILLTICQNCNIYVTIRAMPIIRSAIKKVRKDKLRTTRNKKRETALKTLLKKARLEKSAKNLSAVFSALDKAAKVHLIHPNKAARLKSRLTKKPQSATQTIKLPVKKSARKIQK